MCVRVHVCEGACVCITYILIDDACTEGTEIFSWVEQILSPSSCDSSFFFLLLDFPRAPPSAMLYNTCINQTVVLFSAHRKANMRPRSGPPLRPLKMGRVRL